MAIDFWDRMAFLGGGMAQNNVLGAMSAMHHAQNRMEILRQTQERAALLDQQRREAMRLAHERQVAQMVAPTAAMRNVQAYAGASPELQAIMDRMPAFGGGAPSTVVNVSSGEAAKAAQAESALGIGEELMALVESGAVNPEGIAGLWTKYRESPTVGGAVARFFDDISTDESRGVQMSEMLSQQLLQAMRGAQVGPLEEERFKAALPVFGKPNFKANLRTTLENIRDLENRRRELRGMAPIEPPTGAGCRQAGA